ncbi:MAG: YezD family protein [Verrucomicrobiae bacterium]|nr:YezD family protein [Verrucomicrobiae bacterium]
MPQELADSVLTALKGLEFGSVEITVHHSRIVQIERHERIRFSHSPGRDEARGSAP